ncbi:hypothetical protein [Streptomyces sp. NRRL S-350]|uniref:hypothetical protein n=1 Tax=Streptomyces sp. NRRL S-350 TaxID=1463902 RepID=UPI0004BEEB8C|nr:hypothetical protein [Streptomyces sp. NRRL S-350]
MEQILLTAPDRADQAAVPLPPFSGDEPPCPKCRWAGALTYYRPPLPRQRSEFNGRTDQRGPLPERLERCCSRCDYRWDEALADPADQVAQLLAHPDAIPVPLLITPAIERPPAIEEDVLAMLERCPEADRLDPAHHRDLAGRLIAQADIYPRWDSEPPAGGWPTRATREDVAKILGVVLPDMYVEGRSTLADTADVLLAHAIVHLRPAATA